MFRQEFLIKTNHQSLKVGSLLEQKVGSQIQNKWITKLLGYHFRIVYKQESANKVTDALSKINEEQCVKEVALCETQV